VLGTGLKTALHTPVMATCTGDAEGTSFAEYCAYISLLVAPEGKKLKGLPLSLLTPNHLNTVH
jgi:hypothetical protein